MTDQPIEFDYDNDFIYIENVVGDDTTELLLNGVVYNVYQVMDKDTIIIDTGGNLLAGTYNGGGTAARVSNVQIKSKQWNPYVDNDQSFYLAKIDFGVVKTEGSRDDLGNIIPLSGGQITVDYFPSSSDVGMIAEGEGTTSIMGNNILETTPYDPTLYPFEQNQELLWHSVNFQCVGTFIQIGMSFSLEQMLNPNCSLNNFEIQGMCLYTQKAGRLQ